MSEDGFLARWSRRKEQARQGGALPEPVPPQPPAPVSAAAVPSAIAATDSQATVPVPPADPAAAPPQPAPPTMADVDALTRESDFSRFVAPGVDRDVKNAALKTLFGDPRFNVMDGLDVYIDDYSKPDPLPLASIRKMAQAAYLGLVQAEPPAAEAAASTTARPPEPADTAAAGQTGSKTPEPDEDADLRLQSHDAAGCGGAEDGAAADGSRQL